METKNLTIAEVETLSFNELRKVAVELGMGKTKNPKKAELIEYIKSALTPKKQTVEEVINDIRVRVRDLALGSYFSYRENGNICKLVSIEGTEALIHDCVTNKDVLTATLARKVFVRDFSEPEKSVAVKAEKPQKKSFPIIKFASESEAESFAHDALGKMIKWDKKELQRLHPELSENLPTEGEVTDLFGTPTVEYSLTVRVGKGWDAKVFDIDIKNVNGVWQSDFSFEIIK